MLPVEGFMDISLINVVVGAVVLVAIALLIPVFLKSRNVNLTESSDEKPEWMQSMPPTETLAATKAEGKGVQLFGHDANEKLAAPFAEQIEDIIRAKLEADPYLKRFKIDLGTAKEGGLEIWVNGKAYQGIDTLPDEKLKQAFRDAVAQWDSR